MNEEQLLILQYLLQNAPGKTASQRLNYLQDLSGSLGINLFGGARDYVSQPFIETPNVIGETYRNDPIAAAGFNAMLTQNMSPLQAFQAIMDDEDLAARVPTDTMGDPMVDYLKVFTDFAQNEAERAVERQRFEQQDVFNRQLFEAEQKPGLKDLFGQSVYEAAEQPTEAMLMKSYLDSLRSPKPPASIAEVGSAISGGRTAERFRNVLAKAGVPTTARGAVPAGLERFAEGVARSRAKQQIGEMKRRFVPTDRSAQVQQSLALLLASMGD